jgi:hypothetical protein
MNNEHFIDINPTLLIEVYVSGRWEGNFCALNWLLTIANCITCMDFQKYTSPTFHLD